MFRFSFFFFLPRWSSIKKDLFFKLNILLFLLWLPSCKIIYCLANIFTVLCRMSNDFCCVFCYCCCCCIWVYIGFVQTILALRWFFDVLHDGKFKIMGVTVEAENWKLFKGNKFRNKENHINNSVSQWRRRNNQRTKPVVGCITFHFWYTCRDKLFPMLLILLYCKMYKIYYCAL